MNTLEWNILQEAASHQIKSTEVCAFVHTCLEKQIRTYLRLTLNTLHQSRALLQLFTTTD